MKVTQLFSRRWSVFWATTYTFDLELFDKHLFRQLGDPPLNATIMVDAGKLASGWQRIPPEESWRLRRVNRSYLVRGVAPTNGSFHPKTYLFASDKEARLLVGSGNLTLGGIDTGRECFTVFSSESTDGVAAIRGWVRWMQALVETTGDDELNGRWLNARGQLRFLPQADVQGRFLTNETEPLARQFAALAGRGVDELHVLAPFWDERAHALERLIGEVEPRSISVYAADRMNVDGQALRGVLEKSGRQIHVLTPQPAEFVHAKLIATVRGDEALMLSGSANLSIAALWLTANRDAAANTEACVVTQAPADAIRGLFQPPDMLFTAEGAAALERITYRPASEEEGTEKLVHLAVASHLSDGRIRVQCSHAVNSPVFLTAGREVVGVEDDTTVEPLSLREDEYLVWLVDADGSQVSTKAPVDDPKALRDQLSAREASREPAAELGFAAAADRPEVQMLLRLDRLYRFDIDDRRRAGRGPSVTETEAATEEDAQFWARLAREELQTDPRTASYQRFQHSGALPEDDMIALLALMLAKTPEETRQRLAHARGEGGHGVTGTGEKWTLDRRIQVRLFNVLVRWAQAIGDPRLSWINPTAPTRNYAGLLNALVECSECGYLPPERVALLTETLLSSYVEDREGAGFVARLSEEERHEAVAQISSTTRSLGAGLAYVALDPQTSWTDKAFAWQEFLPRALDLAVLTPDADADVFASVLVGIDLPDGTVRKHLNDVCAYDDEPHWCRAVREDFGLSVSFRHEQMEGGRVMIDVTGAQDLLGDRRLVSVIRRALAFKRVDGATISLSADDRLAVDLGEPIYALINGTAFTSREPVDGETLADLEAANIGFAGYLAEDQAAS